jgi:hypothetical protein
MNISVKSVAIFLLGCVIVGVGSQWLQNDPHHAEVIKFVQSNQELIEQVGPIRSAQLVGITSVQSSISVDDKFTPGYDLYRVSVRGDRASVRVTVERKAQQNTPDGSLRITSID